MRACELDLPLTTHLIRATIGSCRDSVDRESEYILQAIGALPCAQGNLDDIALALSEALANAVLHGNRGDPYKKVHICAACEAPDRFMLAVTDEGQGFDPAAIGDPTVPDNLLLKHGRGLLLIRHLMDETEFRLGGRQVVMRKQLQGLSSRVSPARVG
jgi:serine/threonine-protein kinase RsbW